MRLFSPLPLHISYAGPASADLLHLAIEAMRELIGGLSAIMMAIGCKSGVIISLQL
jgi:hypothetical protein